MKSPKKPLTQIANRLSELECSENLKIKKISPLCECKYIMPLDLFINNQQKYFKVQEVKLQGFRLSCKHPNNVIQLNDGKIFIIDNILNINKNCAAQENIHNLYIYGTLESKKKKSLNFLLLQ